MRSNFFFTDNNRTFHVGLFFVEDDVGQTFANTPLYLDGALHPSQYAVIGASRTILLSSLMEDLQKIRSALSTWTQLDASFSESFTPTVGLVGFLSNAASGDGTWIDDYLCVTASVTNAVEVENGFQFTRPGSGATWPVNNRERTRLYTSVSRDFTLLPTVVIQNFPGLSTSLLGAVLASPVSTTIIGLSHSTEGKWEIVFDGNKTAHGRTWELGKEYQVALMVQEGHRDVCT
ncbi:putative trans-sialidase, Group II [Trypanosoma cruzi]|nr:putative trans-sialidase, Group II [Trypanosoma cruzi]